MKSILATKNRFRVTVMAQFSANILLPSPFMRNTWVPNWTRPCCRNLRPGIECAYTTHGSFGEIVPHQHTQKSLNRSIPVLPLVPPRHFVKLVRSFQLL